jgi:chromate transporter
LRLKRRDIPPSAPASVIALFAAFAKMPVAGFGGVLYGARRAIVDPHR